MAWMTGGSREKCEEDLVTFLASCVLWLTKEGPSSHQGEVHPKGKSIVVSGCLVFLEPDVTR